MAEKLTQNLHKNFKFPPQMLSILLTIERRYYGERRLIQAEASPLMPLPPLKRQTKITVYKTATIDSNNAAKKSEEGRTSSPNNGKGE